MTRKIKPPSYPTNPRMHTSTQSMMDGKSEKALPRIQHKQRDKLVGTSNENTNKPQRNQNPNGNGKDVDDVVHHDNYDTKCHPWVDRKNVRSHDTVHDAARTQLVIHVLDVPKGKVPRNACPR